MDINKNDKEMIVQEVKKTPAKDVPVPVQKPEKKPELEEKVVKFAKKLTKTKLKIGLKTMKNVTKEARVKRDKL